jgi:gliding motility-associated-like protein
MKNRIISILVLIILSCRVIAQPTETIYPGNIIVSGFVDDASYGPFNIGFNFNFFGNTYNQFYVNSNGQVLFGAGSFESADVSIPTATLPNNFIAPFWDDLVVDSYGKILYTTIGAAPNRKLIVQFTNMGFFPFPATLGTFSVLLYESSNIVQVQYKLLVLTYSIKAHGSTASIGLENNTGTSGIQYAFHNPTAVNSEQAISFSPIAGPSYSVNSNAIYDGVFLTTNLTLPDPGITNLINPPNDAVIGSSFNFEWESSPNAASYTLYVGTHPELVGATTYNAGANLNYNVTGLLPGNTYYWAVFSKNATATTWCEIKRFTTSSTPPLAATPITIWTPQTSDKTIHLLYTGGDAGTKTALIGSLPAQGQLYQYNAGSRGSLITSVPASVTDAGMNVIYAATGASGNGAGNFNFKIHDNSGDSPEATVTVNVSPPGVPNILYISKGSGIEIQTDIAIADPTGKQNQFTVTVNGSPASVTSATLKTGDSATIVLTLTPALSGTETVVVSYSAGNVASVQGGFLASFSDQTVTLRSQTISFPTILKKKYGDPPFVIAATTTSGLPISYSSSNLPVASITGAIVTINNAGTSDITCRQLGNATWAPANFTKTLTVAKGDQTITFAPLPSKTLGDADFVFTATASSGLPVNYSSNNTAVATVTGNLVHITGAGSAVITASQPGNATYNAAPDVQQTLTVFKSSQTITFGPLPAKTYGDADFTVTATSSSGLTVSFSGDNPSVATVTTAGLIHITGAGSVVITASQDGNGTYNAAEPVSQTFFVSKAPLTFTADNKSKDYLAQIPVLTYSITGFVNGENQSVLDVLPAIQTAALQNSDAGNYPVTISGGNDNSYSYVYVAGTLTINKIRQILTIVDVPSKLMVKDTYTLIVTSNSGLPVHFEVSDVSKATINGNQLTGVARGVIQIRAISAGDQNYFMEDIFFPVEITSTHKDIMHLFTPNSDGYNDYWEIPEMPEWGRCDVKVYGRTGKLVFSMTNYDNQWNGTSDGKPLPEGAYFFIIKTENAGTVTGTVNIVR